MADVRTIRVEDGAITAIKQSVGMRQREFLDVNFNRQWLLTATGGYGTPTATAGETNEFNDGNGYFGQYTRIGDATILGPKFNYTTGMVDISGDQTGAEGSEFVPGGRSPRNPFGLTIGSNSARPRRHRKKGYPTTVANVGTWLVGFIKNQAYQADYNDYTDLCALVLAGGTVNFVTILNNAATVVTDTGLTVADAALADFDIDVAVNGACQPYFRGNPLGQGLSGTGNALPRFTFDSGDFVIPVERFVHATAATVFELAAAQLGDPQDLNSFPTYQS